jgi:hypothetical protein
VLERQGSSTAPPPTKSTPVYKKWWFWTIIGAVAVGAGVGIYFGARSSGPTAMPELDLR